VAKAEADSAKPLFAMARRRSLMGSMEMTRTVGRLTALRVSRAVGKPGLYADGGGLYLQVTDLGEGSWLP